MAVSENYEENEKLEEALSFFLSALSISMLN